MGKNGSLQQLAEPLGAESPLLGSRGISSHFKAPESLVSLLKARNYPFKALFNIKYCGRPSGHYGLATCKCPNPKRKPYFSIPNCCDTSICPSCVHRRKRRIMHRYGQILQQVPYKYGYFLKFLTFSPINSPSYECGLKAIRAAWRKFIRLDYVKARLMGGIYVIEAKNNLGKGWNIHIHAILQSKWLDNKVRKGHKDSKLVREFKKVSRTEVNVDIQYPKGGKMGILDYMLKYISSQKTDFLDVESQAEYISESRKQRLVTTFGKGFYNAVIEKPVCMCEECHSPIKFSFADGIIEYQINKGNEERKPDPQSLYTWLT